MEPESDVTQMNQLIDGRETAQLKIFLDSSLRFVNPNSFGEDMRLLARSLKSYLESAEALILIPNYAPRLLLLSKLLNMGWHVEEFWNEMDTPVKGSFKHETIEQ